MPLAGAANRISLAQASNPPYPQYLLTAVVRCEDLGNSYTVTYYPQPNPNEGFRRIRVELTDEAMRKYKIRARPGYRPQRGF